jgi:hypothetical protein
MKLSPDEVTTMRTTLTRIMRVGDRLADQPVSWRWRDSIRSERPLLTAAVALAISGALVDGSLAVVRLTRGDHSGLPALGIALLLVAADLAGMLLRRSRCRREQHNLGVELRTASSRLLARLETIHAPVTSSADSTDHLHDPDVHPEVASYQARTQHDRYGRIHDSARPDELGTIRVKGFRPSGRTTSASSSEILIREFT